MFVDCDFIFTRDINELFKLREWDKAVMVAKHDYIPSRQTKMDGQKQVPYPRKNWSSMMLFNCEHESCQKLNPRVVSEQTGAYLHRFQWCQDDEIGDVSPFWNWLEGEYTPSDVLPGAIHYTQGGVWFPRIAKEVEIDYYEEWLKYSDYSFSQQQEIRAWQESLRV